MVVYLFKGTGGSEIGVASALTDAQGTYRFENLSPSQYRLEPSTTGYSFAPPIIMLAEGDEPSPIVAALSGIVNPACERAEFAPAIVRSDAAARDLSQYFTSRVTSSRQNAERKLRGTQRRTLLAQLSSALRDGELCLSEIVGLSMELPEATLSCPAELGCNRTVFSPILSSYGRHLDQLRRLSFYVTRVYREAVRAEKQSDSPVTRKVCRLHAKAKQALRRLPRATQECSAPPLG